MAVVTALLSCVLIFLRSYYSESGCISPDSAAYLGLAENLSLGNGLHSSSGGRDAGGEGYFSAWPIGYPVLIWAVASALHLSVFLASKLVNATLLVACMVVIVKVFGRNGLILSMVMGLGAASELFSYTWSESLFVLFLICFSGLVAKVLRGFDGAVWPVALLIFVSAGGLFLSRYIGAFSIAVVLVLAFMEWRARGFRRALVYFHVAAGLTLLVAAYLSVNLIHSGHLTGIQRIPAPESSLELFKSLGIAILRQLVLPFASWDPSNRAQDLVVIGQILLSVLLLRPVWLGVRSVHARSGDRSVSLAFLGVGVFYLVLVVAMRWRVHFDAFGYRLLHPGVLLLMLALGDVLLTEAGAQRWRVAIFLFAMVAAGAAFQFWQAMSTWPAQRYESATTARLEKYAKVPKAGTVVFGDFHLYYIRPDVTVITPHYKPYALEDETWPQLLSLLDRKSHIFVDTTRVDPRATRYDPSVRAFMAQHQGAGVMALPRSNE
jgi:hypothetical protein